jgi:hypothetical protein
MFAGWGTGKTLSAILRARLYTVGIPDNLGIIFRKTFRSLSDSTIKDYERYTGRKLDGQRNDVYPNGSSIMFRHIDELDSINQQNINLGWFYIEQCEELESDKEFFMLLGRLRRKLTPSKEFTDLGMPERSGWVIGNAADSWIKSLWKDGQLDETCKQAVPDYPGIFSECIEATTWDNQKNLEKDFLNSLKILEIRSPEIYRQYVMNDWGVSLRNKVFPSSLIEAMYARDGLLARHSANGGVAIDPSGEGADDNVFMSGRGGEPLAVFTKLTMSPTEKAIKGVEMCRQINGDFIIVDCDGLGIETYQELNNLPPGYLQGISVIKFHGSAPSEIKEGNRLAYLNQRTEAAFLAQKRGWAGIAAVNYNDKELIEDLKADEYETRNGIVALIPKKEIKVRLKRSPGRGDAWKMLQWAFNQGFEKKIYEDQRSEHPAYGRMDADVTLEHALPSQGRMD